MIPAFLPPPLPTVPASRCGDPAPVPGGGPQVLAGLPSDVSQAMQMLQGLIEFLGRPSQETPGLPGPHDLTQVCVQPGLSWHERNVQNAWPKLEAYLQTHEFIDREAAMAILGLGSDAAYRVLQDLCGPSKHLAQHGKLACTYYTAFGQDVRDPGLSLTMMKHLQKLRSRLAASSPIKRTDAHSLLRPLSPGRSGLRTPAPKENRRRCPLRHCPLRRCPASDGSRCFLPQAWHCRARCLKQTPRRTFEAWRLLLL